MHREENRKESKYVGSGNAYQVIAILGEERDQKMYVLDAEKQHACHRFNGECCR